MGLVDSHVHLDWFRRGMYISFGKPVIRSYDLQQVARGIPLERLLVETDAYPREENRWTEPADVRLVVEKLAEVRGLAVESLGHAISRNLKRLL